MRIGIIGAGNVGSELYRRAAAMGWDVKFVLKSSGVYRNLADGMDSAENYDAYIHGIDVAFLAIPTIDDGKTAFNYLSCLLENGVPAVTCEKGSMSNYFSELQKWKGRIGYTATVGGGTQMLKFLGQMACAQTNGVYAAVNGTLNYIFDRLSKGGALEAVANEARMLGYAEPGASAPLDIINTEATRDVPMKAAILYNVLTRDLKCMRAKDIAAVKIAEPELKQLVEVCNNKRYVVSITRDEIQEDAMFCFKHKAGGWFISACFMDLSKNPVISRMATCGADNALLLDQGMDGLYLMFGPGAGAGPTAASMISDAIELRNTGYIRYLL